MALEAADGRRGEVVTPLLAGDVDIDRRREAFYCAGNRGGRSVKDNYYYECRLKQNRASSSTARPGDVDELWDGAVWVCAQHVAFKVRTPNSIVIQIQVTSS